MSEFELQGLELDNVGLLWGGDLIFPDGIPTTRKFKGTSWVSIENSQPENDENSDERTINQHTLILNKYRVLMTRYRKAMVIFVPKGDPADITRRPSDFDQIVRFLCRCGAHVLPDKIPHPIPEPTG